MTLPRPRPAPARCLAVVCPGFSAERRRRQPWHVADGIAAGLAGLGHEVRLLTDMAGPPPSAPYRVERLGRLITRSGAASPELRSAVAGVEQVFLVTGAFQLTRLRRLELGAPVALVMASPRLHLREFLGRLTLAMLWRERHLLALPLLNALLPGAALRAGFARSGAREIVYLSPSARERFTALGLPPGKLLLPQADPAAIPPPAPQRDDPVTIGYFGPALSLRGADLVLVAFEAAVARGLDARLLLLLRPDGGHAALRHLLQRIADSPQRHRIGRRLEMLPADLLRQELARCHVFLLPFRVTVSEVPLAVIEACLSGRPTIVLDTPGVGEIARALGGTVVRTPDELAGALLEATSRPHASPRDPAVWTDWRRAAAPLLEPATGLARYRLVALTGVDGSGKTFLLQRLSARLAAAGIPHRHVWSRFRNYLSKPFLALARLSGHNRKEEQAGVRIGYHDFAGRPWLAWPFLCLQVLDNLLDLWWRYRCRSDRRLVLADRCLYDTLVDLAVDTGLDEVIFGRLGRRLVSLLPGPALVVVLVRPVAEIRESRPDVLLDRNFARRRALYQRLARELGLAVLENEGPPDAVLDRLEQLALAPLQPGAAP
ncbi:glycosyltransferase [Benzoatithermus flavus]|uniref:Glycosyltransferase n=1 Tax=Benzoatithermus flavus TaxID=3108223 RepID=A0ABU8XWD7_9PROT